MQRGRPGLCLLTAWGLGLAMGSGQSGAQTADPPQLSHYGLAGHIEMPAASALPDGWFGLSLLQYGPDVRRGTLAFQLTPRLTGAFRYSWLRDFDLAAGGASLYDRSFDLQYLLAAEDEAGWRPALAIGLRDLGGTGDFGAEYLVASRHFGPDLLASLGIGWGRLGSYHGFRNPLAGLSGRLARRPGRQGPEETGKIGFERFFRGDAALFFGLDWQASDRLRLSAEYSSDAMAEEEAVLGYRHRSPLSLRASYRIGANAMLSLALVNGSEMALSYSQLINPRQPALPSGREPAPPAVGPGRGDPDPARLAAELRDQGLRLEGLSLQGETATLALSNRLWPGLPQGWGRALRLASAGLPGQTKAIRLVHSEKGMPLQQVTFRRADLEALEFAPDGAWQAWVRADIRDAARPGPLPPFQPQISYGLRPWLATAAFDPDNPLRLDLGAELYADWSPWRGLHFSGALRQKLIGNIDSARRVSDSVLPHVRSDYAEYARASDLQIPWASVDYFFRPAPDFYARSSFGLFEPMFGGLSAELLWAPAGRRFALGAELNRVWQRDFDGRGFQDYAVTTGHLSAYLQLPPGYELQLDAGRYLAGDHGATLTLTRRFENGLALALFATLTDAGTRDFGEGAFDKGIQLTLPLPWLTGTPSLTEARLTLRPVQRDGGARLDLRNRLYALTRPARAAAAGEGWGGFWR